MQAGIVFEGFLPNLNPASLNAQDGPFVAEMDTLSEVPTGSIAQVRWKVATEMVLETWILPLSAKE